MDFPADPPQPIDPPADDLDLARRQVVGPGPFRCGGRIGGRRDGAELFPGSGPDRSHPLAAVVITAPGDRPGIDCVSRVFAPNVGIPEDPVTGSAHCLLAVLWGERTGRSELVGEQASARGGVVRMGRTGDRVLLGGQAVTVSQVQLLV